MIELKVDEATLKPLIEIIVNEVLAQHQSIAAKLDVLGTRLAFSEPEAAALFGVKAHVLRDARMRGELPGSVVGNKIMYTRDDLEKFLANTRWEA